MKDLTGFNSVAFCRALDGLLMEESIRQEGTTAEGATMYAASHNELNCIFTGKRGKTNWTKQGRAGMDEFTTLIGKQLAWGQEPLC